MNIHITCPHCSHKWTVDLNSVQENISPKSANIYKSIQNPPPQTLSLICPNCNKPVKRILDEPKKHLG